MRRADHLSFPPLLFFPLPEIPFRILALLRLCFGRRGVLRHLGLYLLRSPSLILCRHRGLVLRHLSLVLRFLGLVLRCLSLVLRCLSFLVLRFLSFLVLRFLSFLVLRFLSFLVLRFLSTLGLRFSQVFRGFPRYLGLLR